MNYAIESITSISGDRNRMIAIASIRPRTNTSGVWYYPVYGWYINRSYRTEFTGTVSVSTGFNQPSTVNFYLCGPVDEDYFTVEVDPDTGLPNLPIIRQETIYNPGVDYAEDDEDSYSVSASFNIGAAYDNTEIAANEVYILFAVRVGANISDGAVQTNFSAACTDDGPPPYDGEWHIFHAPYYNEDYITTVYDESNPYSVSNISLPQYNLLCFRIDNTDTSGNPKDGSWTVELSAGANAVIYAGTSYRWNSKTGVPSAQYISNTGSSIKWQDINPTMSYIWIRFIDGSSQGDVSVKIYFMETQVQTYWHSETVAPVSMNSGNVLPATGSETWSNGLGEKGVLVYRFKLSENFAPEFSYSGSQSMWMCISTVPDVNSLTGLPQPSNAIRGQGNGTSFTVTASEVLTAGTWYYLFIETITGSPYDGQIVITYGAAPPPEPPEPEWSYGDISDQTDILVTTYRDVALIAQTGARFRVSFKFSGAASFSVSGATDAYIYTTTGDYGFSKTTGRPKDINGNELSDDTSTSIFVAGTGYYTYIWVRGQDADTAGTVTITITPPTAVWTEVEEGEKDITVTDESFIRTYELSVRQVEVYRFDLVFSRSATVRIYSVGSTASSDVMAYFSSVPRTFDQTLGRPDNYDEAWGDAASGDYNFSGVVDVSAGRTYYLWVRGIAADTTAHIWINIAGGGTSGSEKIWIYASNQWAQATPKDYTGNQWKTATSYAYASNQWKKRT